MRDAKPLSNRQRSQIPRGKSFYCGGCDRNHVWAGARCEVCGRKGGEKVRMKPKGIYQPTKE